MSEATNTAQPTLAPWLQTQLQTLLAQRAHALLLQGPSGLGQYSLALALAQAWLCENPGPTGACGTCGSCHLVAARGHPDLVVLMPETSLLALGWPLSEKAMDDIDNKKRKASREIVIESMRQTVQFAQRTAARGRGLVVLVYPAERMNHVAANALLKTLEEPPGEARFVLASEASHMLLPTIRSRCQTHTMVWPTQQEALPWMQAHGGGPLADAELAQRLWMLSGQRPDDALALAEQGGDVQRWALLPKAIQRGDTSAVAGLAPAQVLDLLQKLCHDLMALRFGAAPRFFLTQDLPPAPSIKVLARWARLLQNSAKTVEHPFKADLQLEDLLTQTQFVLRAALHSAP